MAKGFARGVGALFVALGLAALTIGPSANGLVVGDVYHALLHCFFGITLLGFSFRDESQASGSLLLVALMCMAWTLIGYRQVDSSETENRMHGVMAMILASAAAWHMLRRTHNRSRAIT